MSEDFAKSLAVLDRSMEDVLANKGELLRKAVWGSRKNSNWVARLAQAECGRLGTPLDGIGGSVALRLRDAADVSTPNTGRFNRRRLRSRRCLRRCR